MTTYTSIKPFKTLAIAALIAAANMISAVAPAQSIEDLAKLSNQRQSTKNDWRNFIYGSGALGLYGLLRHDKRIIFAGGGCTLLVLAIRTGSEESEQTRPGTRELL